MSDGSAVGAENEQCVDSMLGLSTDTSVDGVALRRMMSKAARS
jgi:hypothetical protein